MVMDILRALFGSGANVVRETAEVFRVNAEAADQRSIETQRAALEQMAGEFRLENRGLFDRIIDGLNRIPRPAMALGTIGLFVAAMVDPLWFGERMAGLALVPEPLWWLLGAIVSFYFGARYQAKGQDFQRSIASTVARAPHVAESIRTLRALNPSSPGVADNGGDADLALTALTPTDNPALAEWRRRG
ncbi:holin family protein [Roseovarius mucosus]|uniref:Holin of 3TMs, for gene-transfer release n=1 Tax=Roseovarius mucosus TaxID=215743 RepID=A0A1V0RJT0_9RHOB|nr:holin family protein [Roseovarius mucosus]ARE82049.1 holin of 3TMs, for gene-transfer release [Roseovarius mucosus]MBW4972364.1 holin family protein [Roseovarius mucosus]